MTDFNLVERENAILGQEFLTWLWYRSERENGLFKTNDGRNFTVFVEENVSVQGGEGDSKETTVVKGRHADFREAKLGLRTGKKVNRATLKFDRDGEEWSVQVKAEDFGLGTLKTPKVETKKEDGDDPDAIFLEKMFLVENCLEFFDVLYEQFLKVRLSNEWPEELAAFKDWMNQRD